VPLSGSSFLANAPGRRCQMEQRAVVRVLMLTGLEAKELKRASQVRMTMRHLLPGRIELEGTQDRKGPPILI
jgi:hypothetical protein